MHIAIYNDQPELLLPFTHFRPSWDIPVGGRTLHALLEKNFSPSDLTFTDGPLPDSPDLPRGVQDDNEPLRGLPDSPDSVILSARTLPSDDLTKAILKSEILNLKSPLLTAPWDLIRYHDQILKEETASRIASGSFTEIRTGVFIKKLSPQSPLPPLPPTLITHTTSGPIILGSSVEIEEYVVLRGPLIIEDNCMIRDFTSLADSYLGSHSRVGGEIKVTNFFGYSNKQHHGFLGHSVVGEWVNLGAGTTTSNLKNTFGMVRISPVSPLQNPLTTRLSTPHQPLPSKHDTNLQFLGSMIGDHAKCAINTTLYTGTILGVNTHAYDVVHGVIPSFTQIFRHQRAELPYDVALTIAERVMARRNITVTAEYKKAFQNAFEKTAPDRTAFDVEKDAKLSFMR